MPDRLRDIAGMFPVEHLADGLQHAYVHAHGSGIVWSDLAVLAAWAVGGLVIAVRNFSWIPATTTA